MRESGGPTQADFDAALEAAEKGILISDTALSDDVEEALEAVRRAAPNPPQNLIDAARAKFDASS